MGEEASYPLQQFCSDLILLAHQGRFSRHPEYSAERTSAVEILARRSDAITRIRKKANPVFVDSDGVERWSILQDAAAALACGDVPPQVCGCRLLMLDYEKLLVGVDAAALVDQARAISANYPRSYSFDDLARDSLLEDTFQRHMAEWDQWRRGNLAYQRLQAVFQALKVAEVATVLFVDHLHRILGGDWESYPFDMAPLLKPLLHRCEIQLWGACTLAEYPIIEHDGVMQRCFQEVCLPSARTAFG